MTWSLCISQVMIIAGLMCGLYRFFRGPDTLNRLLAFDYLCASIIALTTVYSIQSETDLYLELIIIFSLLGFTTVIAFMELYFALAKEESRER